MTASITEDTAQTYRLYGIETNPKWFPLLFVLARGEARSVTSLASLAPLGQQDYKGNGLL